MDKTQDFFKPCILCDLENPENGHFWDIHHLSQKEYYHNYYPRFNLLTGEKLKFKSKEQYFLQDFDSRAELQSWIKKHNEIEIFDYICDFLKRRKTIKGLQNFPCHFESKTLIFPSVLFLIKKFGMNFIIKVAQKTELNLKYDYLAPLSFNQAKNSFYCDTREQSPIKFDNYEIIKLDEGDYCAKNNPNNIFVDKKDFNDATSTLSKGFERFKKEIERAKLKNKYLIMMIEAEFNDFVGIQYKKWNHSQATPEFLFHRCRELLNYDNFQIVFVKNRQNSKVFIEKLFQLQNDIKNIDLFYRIENGEFGI